MVRILVSGTLAALTAAAAQTPPLRAGTIDATGAGDIPTVVIVSLAFVLASIAQWILSSVQIEKMARGRRMNRALLSGVVALGLALFSVDAAITWSKLLASAVAVGLAGPSAVDWLMSKIGVKLPPAPPPTQPDDETPDQGDGGDK